MMTPTGPARGGPRPPPGSVGREARVGTDGSAVSWAGRSVGGTESETPSTDFVGRSLETQSVLSTSLRPAATRLACRRGVSPQSVSSLQPPSRAGPARGTRPATDSAAHNRKQFDAPTRWRGAQPRAPAVGAQAGHRTRGGSRRCHGRCPRRDATSELRLQRLDHPLQLLVGVREIVCNPHDFRWCTE